MCVRGYRVRGACEVEAGLLGMWTLQGCRNLFTRGGWHGEGSRELGECLLEGGSLKERNQRGLTEEGAERRFCN